MMKKLQLTKCLFAALLFATAILVPNKSWAQTQGRLKLYYYSTTANKTFGNEQPECLVDGMTKQSKWMSKQQLYGEFIPFNIIVRAEKEFVLKRYTLTEGNDAYKNPERNWKSWTIYGTNDRLSGIPEWTEIAKVEGAKIRTSDTPYGTQVTAKFAVANNNKAFKYYKIEVNAIVGNSADEAYQQMADMAFFDTEEDPCADGTHYFDPEKGTGICTYCFNGYQPAEGSGTKEDPYLIANLGNLWWFNHGMFISYPSYLNQTDCARLTADIELGAVYGEEFGEWIPFYSYLGLFDGNGHEIRGLQVPLFNSISNIGESTVMNLGVDGDIDVQDELHVGALTNINYGKIINCYSKATVRGKYSVGGICAYSPGSIINCYNLGDVYGDDHVGGICGYLGDDRYAANREIKNCYNYGNVTGTINVGSVCYDPRGTITNCYYLEGTGTGERAQAMTAEQFASGEVAWLLNEEKNVSDEDATITWYQAIGTDAYPTFVSTGSNAVYGYHNFKCDGETPNGTKIITNSDVVPEIFVEPHVFDEDILAETADEGTTNLYSYLCNNCHKGTSPHKKQIKNMHSSKSFDITWQDGKWVAADELTLDQDNPNYNCPIDFTATSLRLARTFENDGWYSLCLPFDVDVADTPFAQVAAYQSVEGDSYQFVTVNKIEAGKAYIVKTNERKGNNRFYNVPVKAGEPDDSGAFVGVYALREIPLGSKVIGSGTTVNPIKQTDPTMPLFIRGWRAYFPPSNAGAKAMYFTVDDGEATPVEAIRYAEPGSQQYYNLNGQKVDASYQGIVVKNGKTIYHK